MSETPNIQALLEDLENRARIVKAIQQASSDTGYSSPYFMDGVGATWDRIVAWSQNIHGYESTQNIFNDLTAVAGCFGYPSLEACLDAAPLREADKKINSDELRSLALKLLARGIDFFEEEYPNRLKARIESNRSWVIGEAISEYVTTLAKSSSQSTDETQKTFANLIGRTVRLLREEQGLTRASLAYNAGLASPDVFIYRIENNTAQGYPHKVLGAVISALTKDLPQETSMGERIVKMFESAFSISPDLFKQFDSPIELQHIRAAAESLRSQHDAAQQP